MRQPRSHVDPVLFVLFFAAFVPAVWFFNGGGQNQNVTFDLTRALVEDRSIVVDRYRDNTIDLSFHRGHYYANKAPGLSFLAAPVFVVARMLTGGEAGAGIVLTVNQYLVTAAINGTAAGAICLLTFLFGRRLGVDDRWSAVVSLLVVVASPILPYTSMLFAHVPSTALFFASLFLATREPPASILAGLTTAIAGSMNYVLIPLSLVPLGLVWVRSRSAKRVASFLAGAVPGAFLVMAYHQMAFGSPFRTAIAHTRTEFLTEGAALGVLDSPSLEALWGITFSPYRGLFFLSPFLLFAFVPLRRLRRDLLLATLVIILSFLMINSSFNGWHGGYTIGPRYLIPIIPLLGLGLLLANGRALRTAIIVAGLWGMVMNGTATAVDPQVPETLRNPMFDYVLPTFIRGKPPAHPEAPWLHDFFTGHVGVNRLSVAERQIFRKFPPGSPETEWASFNLGEMFTGPGSLWSLLPLLIVELALLSWLFRRLPKAGASVRQGSLGEQGIGMG